MLLNLDAGEHDDEPEALWRLFDILAIACGGHAGDAASMARVVAACTKYGISIGAHPSYPDREGFGRRTIEIAPAALEASVAEQCAALAAHGLVEYVKPHGALYHDAARDQALAEAVVGGARRALGDITLIGPPAGALFQVASRLDLTYLREGFADRRTRPDGTLVPRTDPKALLVDPLEAVAQARRLSTSVDTICIHADTPNALAIARAVREGLEA